MLCASTGVKVSGLFFLSKVYGLSKDMEIDFEYNLDRLMGVLLA